MWHVSCKSRNLENIQGIDPCLQNLQCVASVWWLYFFMTQHSTWTWTTRNCFIVHLVLLEFQVSIRLHMANFIFGQLHTTKAHWYSFHRRLHKLRLFLWGLPSFSFAPLLHYLTTFDVILLFLSYTWIFRTVCAHFQHLQINLIQVIKALWA